MKKLTTLATLVMVALAAISCNNREEPTPQTEQKVISVATSLYNFTKATDTAFEADDAIGIHIVTNNTYLDNAKYTYNGKAWKGEQTNYWYKDESVTSNIYAYYPYTNAGAYSAEGYSFTINPDQTTPAGYTASDLMVANTTSKPTAEPVYLNFHHALSKVVININSELEETVSSVMFCDVFGTAQVSLDGATATATGSKGDVKALNVRDYDVNVKDNVWQLIIVPQAEVSPRLIITTSAQKQYTFDIESATTFAGGKVSTATISLTKESISTSFTTEVTDWTADKELNFGQTGSSDVTPTSKTIFFQPNENWLKDGARFAAYFWNESGDMWIDMDQVGSSNWYCCKTPEGFANIIFCRMDPSTKENLWENKWNQSADLTVPTDNQILYTLEEGEWDNGKGSWSKLPDVNIELM
ncbi:MAG: fimbrillin family protein [Tidjanibacter sp.]|nr:fimbrillin family protein [Tidjanibacter sp.]